ncbi:oligosaccharide flippase family protein [Vibrio vulnificus]|nr:oligosaccharide flippase family protein [Vibrio vulnificus]
MIDFFKVVLRGNLLIAFISLLTGIILARFLNADGRGELSIIITYATFISTLSNFSIPEVIVKKENNNLNILNILLLLSLISAFGCSLFFLVWFVVDGLIFNEIVFYAAFFIPANFLNGYLIGVLQSRQLFGKLMWVRIIMPLSSVTLIVAVALLGHLTVNIVIGIYIISNLLVLISLFLLLNRDFYFKFDILEVKNVIKWSRSFHLVTVIIIAATEIDKLLIASALDATSIGNYVVATTIPIALTNLIVSTAQTVLLPMYKKDNLRDFYITCSRFYFLVLTPLMILVGGLLYFIIPVLFGKQYYIAAELAPFVMLSWVFSGFKRLHARTIRGLGFEKIFSISEVIYLSSISLISFFFIMLLYIDIFYFSVILVASSFVSFFYCLIMLSKSIIDSNVACFFSLQALKNDIVGLFYKG